MENSARRSTGGELEETIMSAAGPSATPDVSSDFHTALEECKLPSLDEVALDYCSGVESSMEPKSEYFSLRVEEMMRSESQFSSAVEHEIENSRKHWTEVSGPFDSSENSNDHEEVMCEYYEEVDRENEEVFAELMNDPQWREHEWGEFFRKCPPDWKLGRKIAEGGQAEIFEVVDIQGTVDPDILLKVFKRGSCLSDLKKQWPRGILLREVKCIVGMGYMLEDRRFAFGMVKCWGDLCKLIDQAMEAKNNQGPPFPYVLSGTTLHAIIIVWEIAYEMDKLHKQGIIHRDLKTANILLLHSDNYPSIVVANCQYPSSS